MRIIGIKTLLLSGVACLASLTAYADKPGFVSSQKLQAGGYSLDVKRLSKPVTIRSVRSSQLKPGQSCEVHLDSVRQAIERELISGRLPQAASADKPQEAHIFLKAHINGEGGFECHGQGDTCMIVVTIPPDSQLSNKL